MPMRCSLSGLLANAAVCIDGLMRELRDARPRDFEDIEESHQPDYYAHCLRAASRHAEETAAGKHTLAEFAQVYCLKGE